MTRAVGYARVDKTDRQALDRQRRRVRAHAKAQSWELVDVAAETASAAVRAGEFSSIEHRPILQGLLEQARAGVYDLLLVDSFDRLGSDDIDQQVLARWFGHYGINCVSVATGAAFDVDRGQAAIIDRILSATDWLGVHALERRRFLERVQAGKVAGRKRGRHVAGRIPFGFRIVAGELVPDRHLAGTIRGIFDAAREGDAPGRIARKLNAGNVPSPGDKSWDRGTVRRLLTNPVYAGERHNIKRAHEAIVTRQTFNRVQERLSARGQSGPS